ncbi:hypothetical protein DDE19_11520 [Micromonospora ureilytica]|uniref:DUF998 domain-containing protein n=1 Tax=Micromonospora ureilytica TaxID=709868 RepID=A0A3N9YBE0_9ACTN|nr:DUF998 domain-containing protein [Micromonospora ureilytica]RQX17343.1 hypothetical protein DDE19_11520 [Micromonospora ureilytica]
MSQAATFPVVRPTAVGRDRLLLLGGVLAGPIFVSSAIVQAATRDGFDFRRHPVSVLSTGELGWIQIVTFLATGMFFAVAWVTLIVRPVPAAMVAFGLAVTAGWLWVSVTFARAASDRAD